MKWICSKMKFPQTFVANVWIICRICFTFLMCGSARIYISFLISQLAQTEAITENEISWLSSMSSLFNPIGFLLGGYTMDTFGRKWSTKCVFLPFMAGWALIVCAHNLELFYVGISLHGVASGMTMTSPMYISEISSPEYRSLFLSILGMSYTFGVLIGSIIHYCLSWRHTAIYFFVISVIMYLMLCFIPESPYWLVLKGQRKEAIEILKIMRQNEEVIKEEILQLENCMNTSVTNSNVNILKSVIAAWRQLGILTTFSILHKLTGFTPLVQYPVIFFQHLKIPVDSHIAAIIHSIVCFLSTFLVPYFAHNYRRRLLMIITSIMAGFCLVLTFSYEAVYYDSNKKPYFWIPLIGIYAYDVVTTVGVTSIVAMLSGELLPPEISGIACAVFSITSSVITTIITKTYLSFMSKIGLVFLLGIFTVCCFCTAILTIAILPETHGKTLREIQEVYFRKKTNLTNDKVPVVVNIAVLELNLNTRV